MHGEVKQEAAVGTAYAIPSMFEELREWIRGPRRRFRVETGAWARRLAESVVRIARPRGVCERPDADVIVGASQVVGREGAEACSAGGGSGRSRILQCAPALVGSRSPRSLTSPREHGLFAKGAARASEAAGRMTSLWNAGLERGNYCPILSS